MIGLALLLVIVSSALTVIAVAIGWAAIRRPLTESRGRWRVQATTWRGHAYVPIRCHTRLGALWARHQLRSSFAAGGATIRVWRVPSPPAASRPT